jgi:hypothetical protein
MTLEIKLASYAAGVQFGFQRAMNLDDRPPIEDGNVVSPEAFECGMQAGFLAGYRKRHHL